MISPFPRLGQAILFLALAAHLSGCKSGTDRPAAFEADFPRVLRSVLDKQPRMLSVRLDDDLFISYSTEACAPVKIWRGGIALNGAAYNDIKTIQPTTWGHVYWENPNPVAYWRLQGEDAALPLNLAFRGYTLVNALPVFHYQLETDLGKVSLTETLSFQENIDGSSSLKREFEIEQEKGSLALLAGEHAFSPEGKLLITHTLEEVPTPPPPNKEVTASTGPLWLDRSGCNTCHNMDEPTIGPSYRQIAARYPEESNTVNLLVAKVKDGGSGVWGQAVMTPHPQLAEGDIRRMVRYILSLDPDPRAEPKKPPAANPVVAEEHLPRPGFGAPLEGVHPAFDVQNILPEGFHPRVGGLGFFSDGRLAVSTWDSLGGVYILEHVETGDPEQVQVHRFAAGLHEPLGLEVVNDEVYILQKQELTKLIDHDGDGIADEYRTLCNAFDASADFHEFSYGLVFHDGYFYATLGLAMRLMQNETQLPDRGTTIRMDTLGNFEILNRGLRQPNGIGFGVDNELFILENQGQWVPSSKLIHLREGDFHGCRFHDGGRFEGLAMTPPAVWLPQDEIGNSPSEPVPMIHGPYAGQMLHGEVTHGGVKRVFLEKVDGAYQGAVFRFSQGLEAGINRLAWGPDSALYAGGVGMNGNWGWGSKQFSLERLAFNGKRVFEMLAVRALPKGLEIEFTQPLAEEDGQTAAEYTIEQWRYEPTAAYGGPKLDHEKLDISDIEISPDRQRVQLHIPGIKPGYVLYLRLSETMRSADNGALWAGEAWYTMNAVPK